jgi:acetyltransferase-like isoleucine patch superfamily enzyme
MPYLTADQLRSMNFAGLGHNVKISDKASIYGAEQMRIGDNSRIDDFCVVSGKVEIGRNVHIAPLCLIAGGSPGIVFEDFSGLAYGVKVFTQSDDYSGASLTNPTVPSDYKIETFEPVRVGRYAIVGTNSVISPGVTLAEGTAVGAMTLITRSTEPWSIYLGNPARKIRDRQRGLLELEKAYLGGAGQD